MGQEPLKVKGHCVYESKKSQKLSVYEVMQKRLLLKPRLEKAYYRK